MIKCGIKCFSKKELESLERKRTVLAKLGLTKEEIEDLLL